MSKGCIGKKCVLVWTLLAIKAKVFALYMGIKIFKCSERDLACFKHRNNDVQKAECGVNGATDLVICNEFCENLPNIIFTYAMKKVFNAEETGFS